MNKVFIMGNLGQDPEWVEAAGGICKFSVATNEHWTDKQGNPQERTQWHRVSVFGKSAESCMTYLKAGQNVLVEGKLQYDTKERDGVTVTYTSIKALNVQFLSKPQTSGAVQGNGRQSRSSRRSRNTLD